jgi:hypothetical protein
MTKAQSQYRKKLVSVYKRRKIKNPNRHIDRLFKSVYPAQYNDYIMLKYPKGQDAPVDAPLYPFVRKLLRLGYHVAGWDYNLYRDNGGFIMVSVNKTNRKQNTQKRLADSLWDLFSGDCLVHKKKPKHLSDIHTELVYFSNDAVAINFSEKALKDNMQDMNLKPSKAQVLPGAKATKISNALATKVHDELLPEEIETEDMF